MWRKFLLSALWPVIVMSAVPAVATGAEPIVSMEPVLVVNYHLRYNGFNVADITDQLFMGAGGRYHLRSHARTKGLAVIYGDIIRNSYGQSVPEQGLVMDSYDQRSGRFTKKRHGRVDPDSNRLLLRQGDKERNEPLPSPLFDFLSIVYQPYVLGHVNADSVWLTDGWRLKEYHYEIGEEEVVLTELYGELRTIPLRLRVDDESKRTVWLAPDLGYLPVRAVVDRGSRHIEVALASVGEKQ